LKALEKSCDDTSGVATIDSFTGELAVHTSDHICQIWSCSSASLRLREEFGLYANVRSLQTPHSRAAPQNIDLVLVRENIEGLGVGDLEMLWPSANTAKNPGFRTTYRTNTSSSLRAGFSSFRSPWVA
jgi:isocitrate/isopropylmalate dehydrogenase